MSRNQRIALVVGAVAVAVLAFLVARPGGDDDEADRSAASNRQATAQTETETETEAEPAAPPEPQVTRIEVRAGTVSGGPKTIEVAKGDTVRIVVTSDAPDEIHLHGYDIEKTAAPGQPARFRFKADAEGAFEIESHTSEDAGQDPLVARLVVSPS